MVSDVAVQAVLTVWYKPRVAQGEHVAPFNEKKPASQAVDWEQELLPINGPPVGGVVKPEGHAEQPVPSL